MLPVLLVSRSKHSPAGGLTFADVGQDREISTALLASMSKFFPARACMAKPQCARTLAEALINISAMTHQLNGTKPTDCFMG